MKTIDEFKQAYPGKLTLEVIESIGNYNYRFDENGIRSITYGLIENCIFVCFERSGDIVRIDFDGTMQIHQRG